MTGDPISKKTLARLPLYLGYLREQKGGDQPYISATTIADANKAAAKKREEEAKAAAAKAKENAKD